MVSAPLEIAVAGKYTPEERLRQQGWRVVNPHRITISFDSFIEYVFASLGEFSVCKNIFVATQSGFFSERSAVYLACGRPVVMQETGFSDHIPCGRGLFAVRSAAEAAEAISTIVHDYERQSNWAREIAREYLDVGKVLPRFLSELGI
jgi:hypothetical protein